MKKKVKTKYNAIIIGSGIIGCSIAFELSKKGWKTLNVDKILKQDNRIKGVELADAAVIEAPVVVNASGPHSFIINRLAGVEEGMQIKTRALRHEVVHLPAPSDVDYESIGCPSSDSDIGGYLRPEVGNNILSGSEDP